jgi:S-adenosyl methyltransferase
LILPGCHPTRAHYPTNYDPIVLTRAQVTRFFDGLELLEPGVVQVEAWRPVPGLEAPDKSTMWGGVALKRAFEVNRDRVTARCL